MSRKPNKQHKVELKNERKREVQTIMDLSRKNESINDQLSKHNPQ